MGHKQQQQSTMTSTNTISATKPISTTKHGHFSMVYLDLDDTLIPTTIRNSIRLNYGFELFKIVDTTSLQSDIINSIDKIKDILNKYYPNDSIYFCLVSNATQDWINDMLSNKDCSFPILGEYLTKENIGLLSAYDTATKYLCNKFGGNEAKELISSEFNGNNRFMFKYTTFGYVINKIEKMNNLKCGRVISIGDGECEYKAMQIFNHRNPDIITLNIRLRNAPTISQLQSQWRYIQTCFDGVVNHICMDNNTYFEIDVDKRFKHDNNGLCTGKYQLNAIAVYFNVFMKILEGSTQETYKSAIAAVCQIMQSNMRAFINNKPSTSPKGIQTQEMLKIAYKNEEFHKYMKKMMVNDNTVYQQTMIKQ